VTAPCRKALGHTAFLGLLLFLPLTLQGCLGIVWLGAVGFDSTRTSDIRFHPFEHSWLGLPQERQHLGVVKRIIVKPFVGDPMMTDRWTVVFQNMTDRDPRLSHSRAGASDWVLTGNVIGGEPENSFVGFKETSSKRLYLRLTSDLGTLLWRTELPYTIVKGAKALDEERVTNALLTHVKRYANEIGLAGLGAITLQAASLEPTSAGLL
jgi:hypothetical protein